MVTSISRSLLYNCIPVEKVKIGLIGFGRFGRMTYEYLRRLKPLRVYDRSPDAVRDVPESAPLEEVASCPLIVLCVPISSMEETCLRLAPLLRRGQTVVDTCSVKSRPAEWMSALLPEDVQILGTHPLFGPDSGKAGISGLKIALCSVRISSGTYQSICSCLSGLGLELIETTPDEHDRQIARSQAVFHLIAQTMKELDWGTQEITTPGPEAFYRLVGTVQSDTPELFRDMERENPYAPAWRQRFIEAAAKLDRALSDDRQKFSQQDAPPKGESPSAKK